MKPIPTLMIMWSMLLLPAGLAPPPAKEVVTADFSGRGLPKRWRVSSKDWKVTGGELRGTGNGYLEYDRTLKEDFVLAFDGWTEEKAGIEVQLVEPDGEEALYIFAFLGRYHPVLDGVKFAILKGSRFVSVNPRMWIFPGRVFRFEVRCVKNQYQMFLNRELGAVFQDPDPGEPPPFRIRIRYDGEDSGDTVRLDSLRLEIG